MKSIEKNDLFGTGYDSKKPLPMPKHLLRSHLLGELLSLGLDILNRTSLETMSATVNNI